MTKNKKKATPTKLTKDELSNIQEKVNNINNLQMNVGGLELQKAIAIERVKEAQGALQVVQDSLEKKYGRVSVNINDGSLKEIKDEVNKKN